MSSSFPAARFPALPLGNKEREATEISSEPRVAPAAEPARAEPSDDDLIALIRLEDPEALGLLFDRYARLVWTIGYRILRNKEEAEDLLQDVFLLVRRRATAFDAAKGSVRSLLVQMCYQRAFSRRRDLARRNFYSSTDFAEAAFGAKQSSFVPLYDECLEAHFGRAALQRAIDDLSFEQQETLRLCFGQGYSLEEAADRLGCSVGNARHHYYRGLAKLRKHLLGHRG